MNETKISRFSVANYSYKNKVVDTSVNAYILVLCKIKKLSKCRNHRHHLGSNVSKYIQEIPAACEICSLHSAENETQCDTSQ